MQENIVVVEFLKSKFPEKVATSFEWNISDRRLPSIFLEHSIYHVSTGDKFESPHCI